MNSSLPFRLLFLALAGLWGGTLYRLSALWSAYPNYLYGYSVPLLCLMIFRERWLSRPTPVVPVFSGMGWLLSLIGLTGWGMSRLAFEVMPTWRLAAWGMTLSLICITLGVVYSIGGRAWVRHFILPVGFLLLAVPWPMSLEQPIIAKASSWVTSITMSILTLATVPAIRHGNLIEISTGVVGIDEACSGIRSLQGTLMVSLFLGEIFRLTTARRGLLLATGLASALLLNILRTTSLVWWGDVNGVAALARFHDQAGFGVLGANLIVLAVVSWRWRSSLGLGAVAGPIPPVTANPRLTVPFSYSLTMVVLLVLAEGGTWLWFVAPAGGRTGPDWKFAGPPAGVRARSGPLTAGQQELLQTDESIKCEWMDDQGFYWKVFYLRWLPAGHLHGLTRVNNAFHPTDVCLAGAGKTLLEPPRVLTFKVHDVEFLAREFHADDSGRDLLVQQAHWTKGANINTYWLMDPTQASTKLALSQAWRMIADRQKPTATEHRVILVGVWVPPKTPVDRAVILNCLNGLIRPG